jgi:hypothetical protein
MLFPNLRLTPGMGAITPLVKACHADRGDD